MMFCTLPQFVINSNGKTNLECIRLAQTKTPLPSWSRVRSCSMFLVLADGSLCSKQSCEGMGAALYGPQVWTWDSRNCECGTTGEQTACLHGTGGAAASLMRSGGTETSWSCSCNAEVHQASNPRPKGDLKHCMHKRYLNLSVRRAVPCPGLQHLIQSPQDPPQGPQPQASPWRWALGPLKSQAGCSFLENISGPSKAMPQVI